MNLREVWAALLGLLGNTSPLELLVSVASLAVSFAATVLATAIGVGIALWTQRRDFRQRRDELLAEEVDLRKQAVDSERRALADRLIEFVVELEENALMAPGSRDDDSMQRAVDTYFNRFKYFPEPDALGVFSAVFGSWLAMQSFRGLPIGQRQRKTHPYASLLQTNLARWAGGEISASQFPPVNMPR